jgi:hypothetical protein
MGEVHVTVEGQELTDEVIASVTTPEKTSPRPTKDWCREHPYAEDTLVFNEDRFIRAEAFLSTPRYTSGGEGHPRVTIEITFQPGPKKNPQMMRFLQSELEGVADLFAGSALRNLVENMPMRANTVLSVGNNGSRFLDIEPSVSIRLTRHDSYPIIFQLREDEVSDFYRWITGDVMRSLFALSVAKVKRFEAEMKERRARRDIGRAREAECRLANKIEFPKPRLVKSEASPPEAPKPEEPKVEPKVEAVAPEAPKPEEPKVETPAPEVEEPKKKKRSKKKA